MWRVASKAVVTLRRGLTAELGNQSALARRLNITQQALSGYLTGKFKPEAEIMARIEDELGIPMRDWLTEADEVEAVQ